MLHRLHSSTRTSAVRYHALTSRTLLPQAAVTQSFCCRLRWFSASGGAEATIASTSSSSSHTIPSTAATPPPPSRPSPAKSTFTPIRRLDSIFFSTPAPPLITSQSELDDLIAKAHIKEKEYDMLMCYQLGEIYFDGISPATSATSNAAISSNSSSATPTSVSTATTASSSSSTSSTTSESAAAFDIDPSAPSTLPWSLAKNYTQSLLWYTNAAFEGHVPSRTRLGVMYLAGYGIKRNLPVALQLFTESSQAGDAIAQSHLASMYLQGVGCTKDVGKAIELYKKAADRGLVKAQAMLVQLLDSPTTAAEHRDPTLALHWLRESARLGHVDSIFSLAEIHAKSGELQDAYELHMTAALKGHKHAQYLIGFAHLIPHPSTSHLPPSERDTLAVRWLQAACDRGHVRAQAHFGFLAYHGVGMKEDRNTGIMWLSNAGEANHIDAQLMLGSIAYDEYVAASWSSSKSPSSSPDSSLEKKLTTAKHYFDKVLETANKVCATLPPGSLPLLVKWTQTPSEPSRLIKLFQERTGRVWLGDINIFLREMIEANKEGKL